MMSLMVAAFHLPQGPGITIASVTLKVKYASIHIIIYSLFTPMCFFFKLLYLRFL